MRKSIIIIASTIGATALAALVIMASQIMLPSEEEETAVLPLQVEPNLRESIVIEPGETKTVQFPMNNRESITLQYETEILTSTPPSEPELAEDIVIENGQSGPISAAATSTIELAIQATEGVEPGIYSLHLEVFSPEDNRSSGWYFPIDVVI